jgi:hypothetical protein
VIILTVTHEINQSFEITVRDLNGLLGVPSFDVMLDSLS